jgi:hypothetical protein
MAELLQSNCTNECEENKPNSCTKSHIIAPNVSDTFWAHVGGEYSVCCFYSTNKIIRYVSSLHIHWAFDSAVCSNLVTGSQVVTFQTNEVSRLMAYYINT